jgi:response regulator RpfG family c-di-GMP phosphodiesterase/tRNA A-37 threonylcarbamoyl transferase component Bud32
MVSSLKQRPTPACQRRVSPWLPQLPEISRSFLDELIRLNIVPAEEVHPFLEDRADRLDEYAGEVEVGQALIEAGLLTPFQLDRVLAGQTHGLMLGNYRVLDQIGSGGMGLVYLGEHSLMKRRVAIKVLPLDDDCDYSLRQRFYAEMRLLAELNHPNIVQAFDAGELASAGPHLPILSYLVMELISGGDLEQLVERSGPLSIPQACDWIRQASQGLQAAHDLHVVHRDIKPSNLLLTEKGQLKLVDFGLAHQFCSQLTDPRALLGSVEFMAPEQSHDPSGVGPPADIYSLAGTLFWLLSGEAPYPYMPNLGTALRTLQTDSPRRLSDLRPDVPPELDDLIDRMLSRDPASRPTPLAVSTALAPLAISSAAAVKPGRLSGVRRVASPRLAGSDAGRHRVLVIEDDHVLRAGMLAVAEQLNCRGLEARDGDAGLEVARREAIDVVVVSGVEVCWRLREQQPASYLKIILITDTPQDSMPRGADDVLVKPIDMQQLRLRMEQGLRIKAEQDRTWALIEQYQRSMRQLEQSLESSRDDVRQAHDALLFTMAKMAESRDGETPGHLRRLQRYVVALAREAARERPWTGLVDGRFLNQLERCVVLHDIGKIGLPDDILLKPASLSEAERILVQTHPLIGDRILEALGQEHGAALNFLCMGRDIVRHHHERWDGAGYPDRLSGEAIPPAARLTAIADVYDALRRERMHKSALTHARATAMILQYSTGQFDPSLLAAFANCSEEFERTYREVGF